MPEFPHVRFLPSFEQDVEEALAWSEEHFGTAAADRYAALIRTAILDIASNPTRPGARARTDILANAYTYRLLYSRDIANRPGVRKPRHFILYRYRPQRLELARLLHESRDLTRYHW